MPDSPPVAHSLLSRIAEWVVAICGAEYPDEVISDLGEEVLSRRASGMGRLRTGAWGTWQLVGICAYAARDRVTRALGEGKYRSGERRVRRMYPMQAMKLAGRRFRHEPTSAITAALTLAIGFGAAAAIFSVIVGFNRDLPVPQGDRIVRVSVTNRVTGGSVPISAATLNAWIEDASTVDGLGAFRTLRIAVASDGVTPTRVGAAMMTEHVLPLLGVSPAMGRFPSEEENNAVLISYRIWREVLKSDADAVGRTLRVGDRVREVVGVMPEGFQFPFGEDLWMSLSVATEMPADLEFVARLGPGVTTDGASAELGAMLTAAPDGPNESRIDVQGFTRSRGESGENVGLMALLMIVVALLLVSCANVSNILLVRAAERATSMAVHRALGAGPRQIVLQMFAEAAAIAFVGAAVGLVIAFGAVQFIEGMLSGHWGYFWMRVAIDPQVLFFTVALAVVTALVSGMLPAIRSARTDIAWLLTQTSARTSRTSTGLASWGLLTGQVTFSCVALAASGMMALGLLQTRRIADGFPADSVVVASLTLDGDRYRDPAARRRFGRSLVQGLGDLDPRYVAGLSTGLPGLNAPSGVVELEGVTTVPDARPQLHLAFSVTENYFRALNLRTLAGRTFSEDEVWSRSPVAAVSEDFARQFFGGADPIGRRIRVGGVTDGWVRIIGVVSNVVIYRDAGSRRRDWIYLPFAQTQPRSFYVLARAPSPPSTVWNAIGRAVGALDPALPLDRPMGIGSSTRISDVLAFVRRIYETVGALALLAGIGAILVAAIGLYAVVAFEVQQTVRDIGIRMALGAEPGRELRRVLWRALVRLAPGLVLGIGLAYLVTPIFGVFLSGMDPRDPRIFAVLALGYVGVALAAAAIPARRAAALDPTQVLRND